MFEKLKYFYRDLLDVSKLTRTKNKKIKIFFLIVFLNFQIFLDIVIILFFSKYFSQEIGIDNSLINAILKNDFAFPISILFRYLFMYLEKYLTTQLRFDIEKNLKIQLLKQVFAKGNLSIGDSYYFVNIISEQVGSFYATLAIFLSSLIQIFVFSIYLSFSNYLIFLVFILGLLIISIPTYFLTKYGRKNAHKAYEMNKEVSSSLEKVLDNLYLIKILNKSNDEINLFTDDLKKYFQSRLNEINSGTLTFILPIFLTLVSIATLLVRNISSNIITFDFIGVLIRLFQALSILNKNAHVLTAYHVYLEKLYLFEKDSNEDNSKNYFVDKSLSKNVIEVKNVDFKYFHSTEMIFKNLNLQIKKNSHTVIVGPNGSGKSTLIGLISGVLFPTSGTIISGSNKIGYVGAKPMILNDTLLNNILYGNSEKLSNEKILSLIDLFKLFENKDQDILQKHISNKNLSSGQMQKISFIRALASNIDLLILDEATANLDLATKQLIYSILQQLNITIINSTHSIEEITQYDQKISIDFENSNRKIKINKNK